LEGRIREIGMELFGAAAQYKRGLSRHDLDARLMEWAMKDELFKVQLFRFVDVLPMLAGDDDVLAHLLEYLGAPGVHFPLLGELGQKGMKLAAGNRLAGHALASTMKAQIGGMAHGFIAGADVREAAEVVKGLRKGGMAFTMDILGEVTVSEAEAAAYQQQYLDLIDGLSAEAERWAHIPGADLAGGQPIPRVNVSIKLSALSPRLEPADPDGTAQDLKARLRPILELAKARGAFVNIDMEHYAIKDVTLKVFRELIMEPDYRDWPHLGIVLQAYLRESERDAGELLALLRERGTPAAVRLVKGAYWDYETVIARQRQWPIPVFTSKAETDASFERMADLLLAHYPLVNLAVASHNVRSMAAVIAGAEERGLPTGAVEFQMLYGMGNQLKHAVLAQGQRLRVYTPFGELIPGMAYLVRRLLENTANTSFLRQGFSEGVAPEQLLRDPAQEAGGETVSVVEAGFRNVPERNYSLSDDRQRMESALERVRSRLGQDYPLVIGGRAVTTGREIISLNPARPVEIVGRAASAGREEVEQAVEAAREALPGWRNTPASERAGVLRRAAALMENERDELAALEVFEVGKNWREADADVCETIDYLYYYSDEMERLAGPRRLGTIPGETNTYFYESKGVAVIIPPWNFPLAICAGMTSAALVTGNTAIMKPASQSPVIAAAFTDILRRAGLPDGVLNFLPGPGEEVGELLVTHPEVHLIAFTGSRAVGSRINRLAADIAPGQHHLKKVIAEMGGKNAVIVDSDADLDEAVLGTVHSAFGYQGQKCSACSRAIVLEPVYDRFVARLVEATRSLTIGPPEAAGNFMGPVIDEQARQKILRYIEIGKQEATLALQQDIPFQSDGYYVGPTIFTEVPPDAVIAREEIFGPVLSVMRAKNFEQALEIALGTDYALTGGVYSRLPAHLERARRAFRVGNLYLNRKITGAIVGRQLFGGFNLSGIGSKAGGPDYLLQFLDPRTVTENTMRRGFAPESLPLTPP
jgi:RHH-type proline utilization regulon transcriptional repressor/proline dehydrogenase/delta 1-pyrroline-5-carboxylate dehydrogenase